LSVDLGDALETSDVDLVDIHAVSHAATIFEQDILLVGEIEHATELRRQLTTYDSDQQSSRNRLDATVERVDDHLSDDDVEVPVTGNTENNG
jgi:hypothetical protein